MRGLPQKQNARRADKIRLCGHLGRYKKIVKKTYIIYYKYFFITVKLRAIAVRNVLRQPLILPCSTCEAVRNFRYQRSCCRQII